MLQLPYPHALPPLIHGHAPHPRHIHMHTLCLAAWVGVAGHHGWLLWMHIQVLAHQGVGSPGVMSVKWVQCPPQGERVERR